MKVSIRAKIISGFAVVFAISMVIGIYGLYSIRKISSIAAEQAKLQEANASILNVLSAHYVWRQNLSVAVFTNTEFTGSYDSTTCALGKWRLSKEALETADQEITSLLNQVDSPHDFIHSEAKNLMDMMKNGEIEQAQKDFVDKVQPRANEAIDVLAKMTDHYNTLLENQTDVMEAYGQSSVRVIVILIVLGTILCLGLVIMIIKSIMKPLRSLAKSASIVATGNFSVNFAYAVNDEVGVLTRNFASLVDTFKLLISDLNKMSERHTAGETDYFMKPDEYNGEFQTVVSGVNFMIKEYVENMRTILGAVGKCADGDFNAKLELLPGKKRQANVIMDNVSQNLRNVEKSVMLLVQSAMDGQLDKRVDESIFTGDWKQIINGMNQLLEAVDAPLTEAQNALSLVSGGRLDVKMEGSYKGEFEKMSSSINRTIESLSMYVSDISSTLNELASDNFDVEITKDYAGNFSNIKTSLNKIINRLNNVMDEIGQASDQVAAGAGQISETSMSLSQGATEQASSVEELNASIDTIHNQIVVNAESSSTAKTLSSVTKSNAEQGNAEMRNMLNSMNEINKASQDISKIIKVIDDIAFQTNLLALNAAVEAARAGTHGKGFAVVAEEVRNLAVRSQNAAGETTTLIEHSMAKANEGTKIANETAKALETIVGGISDVSDIINQIEASSKEQAASIAQIQEGIGQISEVTQQNSATSEESAAAAEELSSQSEMLKTMIRRFKLKA